MTEPMTPRSVAVRAGDLAATGDYSSWTVTPGHPVKAGAGYDCACGECLYRAALMADRGDLLDDECDCGAVLDKDGRCWYCDRAWIWSE